VDEHDWLLLAVAAAAAVAVVDAACVVVQVTANRQSQEQQREIQQNCQCKSTGDANVLQPDELGMLQQQSPMHRTLTHTACRQSSC
jgi:azurin